MWFQDESRVGQQGRLTRVWSEKGKRVRINKDVGFKCNYIYGAICPDRDTGEAIVIDAVSKEATQAHLRAISKRIPRNHHGVVIMDNAPWHKDLSVPANITIINLPSYSPELNPQENIWQYLKNNFLSNLVFKDAQHITKVCCEAWRQLCQNTGIINSIGTRSWATIN